MSLLILALLEFLVPRTTCLCLVADTGLFLVRVRDKSGVRSLRH
jgi:hypothetical protein